MSINQEVYGAPEQWTDAFFQQAQITDKNKLASFGTNAKTLSEGVTAGKLSYGEPIDKSLSYCGLGTESAMSHVVYCGLHDDAFQAYDSTDRQVTNFAFFEKQTNSQYLEQRNIWLNELDRVDWSENIDTTWNYTKDLIPYTLINPHNILLYVSLAVSNGDGTYQYTSLNYFRNNYQQYNWTRIARVKITPYFGNNDDNVTWSSSAGYTPIPQGHSINMGILDEYVVSTKNKKFYMYENPSFEWIPFGFVGANTIGSLTDTNLVYMCYIPESAKSHIKYDNTHREFYIEYYDELIEDILKTVACFGLYFCTTTADLGNLTNEYTYIGLIDDDGVGHGRYLQGADTVNAPQAAADYTDMHKIDYDPNKPPPPLPGKDPILPSGLYFTMAGRGTGIWALTPTEIDQAWNDIFGSDVDVKMFGNNPMNAILSLKWTPFDWTQTGIIDSGPIVLGDQTVNILHSYPMIKNVSNAEKHGWGTIQFTYDKNFYNARFMQARLFLPFYGYYELPTAQLLSSKLRLDFYYDVPDELGVYIISYDDVIYDYVECSVDMDVPLTGSNAAAINESKRSQALSIASQVAATAATSIIGASTMAGFTGAGRYLAGAIDVLAGETGVGFADVGLETEAYFGGRGSGRAFTGSQAIGIGAGIAGAAASIANTIRNGRIERAALKTNLPYHGSALQTTFLHMSMKPYVQIFKNAIMENLETKDGGTVKVKLGGASEAQYKLKVGHACDIWAQLEEMPEDSLLQTTGMADMSSMGMELAEAQELNSILQSGFFK